jgi:predicted dinucleotide-binding enzyme
MALPCRIQQPPENQPLALPTEQTPRVRGDDHPRSMPPGPRTTGFRDSNDRVPSAGCAQQQLGKGIRLTTAIIGVGNIGSTLARQLVGGDEPVIVAAKDEAHAETLANELGPLARAATVEDAIANADAVVFAVWLDTTKELIAKHASLLPDDQSAGSVVAALLPASAHYVKAFGTLGAPALASGAHREPRRAVLFYATDDDTAAATIERLIRAAGFEPLQAGAVADAGRLEMPGGDLHQFGLNGELLDLDQARAAIAARKVTK